MTGSATLIVAQIVESSIAKYCVTVASGAIAVIRHKLWVVRSVNCVCVALHVAIVSGNTSLEYFYFVFESKLFVFFSTEKLYLKYRKKAMFGAIRKLFYKLIIN